MTIARSYDAGGVRSQAIYSPCGTYRYLLSRDWGGGGRVLYILLNPSTATEERNDPTVERCERRARALGYGGFAVANLFAYRATDPADLKRADQPVGPDNDDLLHHHASEAALILCGWGVHGAYLKRGAAVLANLRSARLPLWHLGLTKAGHPRHPLYVAYSVGPIRWASASPE
ncbi:MAG: DUF1643 domain-containing protein [Albidovulum sp.]